MRTVSPRLGTSITAALLVLLVSCTSSNDVTAPTTGSLTVSVSTSGAAGSVPDYTLKVDGDAGRVLAANGTITLSDLTEGNHDVQLDGLPAGCTAGGQNPRVVTVVAGGTASTTFQITCSPPPGSLEITITTVGVDPAPNGYTGVLDGIATIQLPVNGVTTIPGFTPGTHEVQLAAIPLNCAVSRGENPVSIAVTSGQTSAVAFEVTCVALGSIEITITTTGEEPDQDGYLVSVDDEAGTPVPSNGVGSVPGLAAGGYGIKLSGIADNCSVSQDNPSSVVVVSGQATPVGFDVTCRVLPVLRGVILFNSDRSSTFPRYHLFRMKSDGSQVVDLTSNSDGQEGRISPDGRRIAFTSYRDGNGDIFLMDADGARVTQLTRDPADDTDPVWSPDGRKIAFVSTRGNGGSDVWIMNADGTGAVALTTTGGFDPSWSPDGTLIAFSRILKLCQFDVCSAHIFVVPAGGGSPTDLTGAGDVEDYEPAWSPDGSLIAYQENDQIWTMGADGSGKVKLSQDDKADRNPVWSPDGSKIAFRRLLATSQVFVMNANGSGATNLSNSSANDAPSSWR